MSSDTYDAGTDDALTQWGLNKTAKARLLGALAGGTLGATMAPPGEGVQGAMLGAGVGFGAGTGVHYAGKGLKALGGKAVAGGRSVAAGRAAKAQAAADARAQAVRDWDPRKPIPKGMSVEESTRMADAYTARTRAQMNRDAMSRWPAKQAPKGPAGPTVSTAPTVGGATAPPMPGAETLTTVSRGAIQPTTTTSSGGGGSPAAPTSRKRRPSAKQREAHRTHASADVDSVYLNPGAAGQRGGIGRTPPASAAMAAPPGVGAVRYKNSAVQPRVRTNTAVTSVGTETPHSTQRVLAGGERRRGARTAPSKHDSVYIDSLLPAAPQKPGSDKMAFDVGMSAMVPGMPLPLWPTISARKQEERLPGMQKWVGRPTIERAFEGRQMQLDDQGIQELEADVGRVRTPLTGALLGGAAARYGLPSSGIPGMAIGAVAGLNLGALKHRLGRAQRMADAQEALVGVDRVRKQENIADTAAEAQPMVVSGARG